jgi:hypothetical protein
MSWNKTAKMKKNFYRKCLRKFRLVTQCFCSFHINMQWNSVNLLALEFSIYILAHPVCKMWIIQEPKKVALWNKRHFEKKNGERAACLKYSLLMFAEIKYIKCNIWRVAVSPSYIWDARFLKVKTSLLKMFPSIRCQNNLVLTFFHINTQHCLFITFPSLEEFPAQEHVDPPPAPSPNLFLFRILKQLPIHSICSKRKILK